MNARHIELCGGDEWAATVRTQILPWVLEGAELGDDVLEVGPGPGRTTDVISEMVPRVTAVELDPGLAQALAQRFSGSNVEVFQADATSLPLPAGRYSAALSFTMLHHVPSIEQQDRLLAELARVLRPGGLLAGVDSLDSEAFRALHEDDVCVPLDPAGLPGRLVAAGFTAVRVDVNAYAVRFRASKPKDDNGTPGETP